MLQEHFSRESEKNGFLNYRKNLWDNQMDKKQEEGLVIDFENIPENINAFLLYITLNDISKRSVILIYSIPIKYKNSDNHYFI